MGQIDDGDTGLQVKQVMGTGMGTGMGTEMTDDAAAVKAMIDNLEDTIGLARGRSDPFVARLLEMARLELLLQYHGIQERELDTFCEALAQQHGSQRDRRSIILGDASPRRARRGRSKRRSSPRSAGHVSS